MSLLLLLWNVALAADPPDTLRDLEAAVARADGRRADLTERVRLEASASSEARETSLFEDALYAYLLEDWPRAAMGFHVLVNLGTTDGPILSDSEWYLADALYQMGFVEMAAAEFQLVSNDDAHPFRDDALERLLLLYAEHGPPEAFQRVYERALADQERRRDTRLTYTLGKAWYRQGGMDQALGVFERVPTDSAWYVRARYWMGVIDVREGRLDSARDRFAALAERESEVAGESTAIDLARMGVARILFEQGLSEQATDWYQRVPDDSPVAVEAQEEIAWAWLASEEYLAALDSLERFRRLHPLHPEVGHTQLLTGHVFFKQEIFLEAELSYRTVSTELGAVRSRLETVDIHADETKELLTDLDLYEPGPEVPPRWVLERVATASSVSEALAVERELERQRLELEECQALVDELTAILGSSPVLGRYQLYRRQTDTEIDTMVGLMLGAMAVELDRLTSTRGTRRATTAMLRERLDTMSERALRIAGDREIWSAGVAEARAEQKKLRAALDEEGPWGDTSGFAEQLELVESDIRHLEGKRRAPALPDAFEDSLLDLRSELRKQRSLVDPNIDWSRIDRLYGDTDIGLDALEQLRARVGSEEDAAREPVEAVLATETERVAVLAIDHRHTLEDGVRLWSALGQHGVDQVAAWLRSSERDAAAGVVDIAWNRLMTLRDRRDAEIERADGKTADIEAYYEVIRQRLQ